MRSISHHQLGLRPVAKVPAVSTNSERLRQTSLTQNGIRRMPTRNVYWHSKALLRDRAMPDFVASFALPYECAARRSKEVAKRAVKLRSHLRRSPLCFAQRGDLDEHRFRIGFWVVVAQQVKRHCRYFVQEFVKRGRVRSRRDVVAMAAPD